MARTAFRTLPRWIFLAGISFFGLIAVWLGALILACSTLAVSLSLFASGELSLERAQTTCKFAGPASSTVERNPLLDVASGENEIGAMFTSMKSVAILIHTSCNFLGDYSRIQSVIRQDEQISLVIADELRLAVKKFSYGLAKSAQLAANADKLEATVPILNQYRDFVEALSNQSQSLKRVFPLMLHAQSLREKEHWFIGFQNLAEARSTGGMISNYAILQLEPDGWEILESGTNLDLLANVPLRPSNLYKGAFEVIGANPRDWRDINSIPESELILESIRSAWAARKGYQIDGVLFVGQGLAAQLIAATGEINWRGEMLDATDLFEFLSGDFYEYESNKEARTRDLELIFDQAVTGLERSGVNLKSLATYLTKASDGDWLQVYSSNPGLAKAIEGGKPALSKPEVKISINNVGANKLDRYSFVTTSVCSPAQQGELTLSIEFENRSPRSGLPPHVSPLYKDEKGNALPFGTARVQILLQVPGSLDLTDFRSSSGLEAFPILDLNGNRIFVLETLIPPGAKVVHFMTLKSLVLDSQFRLDFSPMLNRPKNIRDDSICAKSEVNY